MARDETQQELPGRNRADSRRGSPKEEMEKCILSLKEMLPKAEGI